MTIEAISSAQPDRIDHYTTFWSDMVVPGFKEFMQEQHDLRRAFHSALSLFHMSDWVYGAEKAMHISVSSTKTAARNPCGTASSLPTPLRTWNLTLS